MVGKLLSPGFLHFSPLSFFTCPIVFWFASVKYSFYSLCSLLQSLCISLFSISFFSPLCLLFSIFLFKKEHNLFIFITISFHSHRYLHLYIVILSHSSINLRCQRSSVQGRVKSFIWEVFKGLWRMHRHQLQASRSWWWSPV